MDVLSSLLNKYRDVFPPSHEDQGFVKKQISKGASINQDDAKKNEKFFYFILRCSDLKIIKPWSENQYEFIVRESPCLNDASFNPINCLYAMSAFAFVKGNMECLEEIRNIAVNTYQHAPNAGFLMNILGVMFSEKAEYVKSYEFFCKAKSCFEHEHDHLNNAIVTLNLAALCKVLGEYKEARHFCDHAADLCHDISMRTTQDVLLPIKVLRRVADLLEELGNYEKFRKILSIVVPYDISSASEACEVDLTKRLMKIQLKEQNGEKIDGKELEDFTSYLLALMERPDKELLSVDFLRTGMITARINRKAGHPDEAFKLLEKLEGAFLLVRDSKYPLYGVMLFQIGRFKFGSQKFSEAKSALKQAEKILVSYFGRSHHVVAFCRKLLGASCAELKDSTMDATKHLKEALTVFRNINHQHVEEAEIMLKFADLYIRDGKVQCARETSSKAINLFIEACGEISPKTASGYIQSAQILQKVHKFRGEAAGKMKNAIDIFLNLGLRQDHPDVVFCQYLLGELQLSLGKNKEAEQYFVDAQNQESFPSESGRRKSQLNCVVPEVSNMFIQGSVGHAFGSCPYHTAKIVSLVSLVNMKKGSDRQKYLYALLSCLEESKTDLQERWNFAGHSVYCFSYTVCYDKIVYCIISLDPNLKPSQCMDNGNDSNLLMLSSSVKSSCVLFWRSSCSVLEMKELKHLELTLRDSVTTLFLQPKFRKVYDEGKDFCLELTIPEELEDFSLCMQIDLIPLLTELKLTKSESHKKTEDSNCLTSWSSFLPEPSVHVSYFYYKFCNRRVAEFAFDHLISSLREESILKKLQVVEISSAPTLKNIAFSSLQELRPSSLSIVVDSELPLLTVKCCTLKESQSNCICFSVQNYLENAMKTLCEVVPVNFETSVKMFCDGVRVDSYKESASSNSSLDVKPEMSYPSAASETVDSPSCASNGDSESGLESNQSVEAFCNWVHLVIFLMI